MGDPDRNRPDGDGTDDAAKRDPVEESGAGYGNHAPPADDDDAADDGAG